MRTRYARCFSLTYKEECKMSDAIKKYYKPTIRFNIDEQRLLDSKAKEFGTTTPKYIRLITRASIHNKNAVANLKPIEIQLRRIGANINQIAKHLNSHKSIDPEIHKHFNKLTTELNIIKQTIADLSSK